MAIGRIFWVAVFVLSIMLVPASGPVFADTDKPPPQTPQKPVQPTGTAGEPDLPEV